jgi:hypothetical protein
VPCAPSGDASEPTLKKENSINDTTNEKHFFDSSLSVRLEKISSDKCKKLLNAQIKYCNCTITDRILSYALLKTQD